MKKLLLAAILITSLAANAQNKKIKNDFDGCLTLVSNGKGLSSNLTLTSVIDTSQIKFFISNRIQVRDSLGIVAFVDTTGKLIVIDSLRTIRVLLKVATHEH